jgi:hypothetical protein
VNVENVLFGVSYIALWLLVALNSFILIELVRRVASGGRQGTQSTAPIDEGTLPNSTFAAIDARTGMTVESTTLFDEVTLLALISPNCAECESVADEVEGFRRRNDAQLVVICRGNREDCRRWGDQFVPGTRVLLDPNGDIAADLKVATIPTAVLIDAGGQVLRYGQPKSTVTLGLETWDSSNEARIESSS